MDTLEAVVSDKALTTEHDQLKQLAESSDAGLPSVPDTSENRATETTETKPSESVQTQAQPPKTEGQPVKTIEKTDTSKPDDKTNVKPETEYQKKKSRAEYRIEELAREKNELKTTVESLKAKVDELSSRPVPTTANQDKPKYTKEFLKRAISEFEKDGDDDKAKLAREELGKVELWEHEQSKLKEQEQQQVTAKKQAENKEKFLSDWQKHVNEEVEKNPDLNIPSSPLAQTVKTLLDDPRFSMKPDGFKDAVQIAKWKNEAESVSGLKQKITELDTENKRLNNLTSLAPTGGPTEIKTATKDFNSLSMEEQRKVLVSAANSQE